MPRQKNDAPIDPHYLQMLRDYKLENKRRKKSKEVGESIYLPLIPKSEIDSDDPPLVEHFEDNKNVESVHSMKDFNLGSQSSDSDAGFEDVDLSEQSDTAENGQLVDINISLDCNNAHHLTRVKKSSLSKPARILVHKVSLIAWMAHSHIRNKWLADSRLLKRLGSKDIIPEKILLELRPPAHLTPFLKSKIFIDGLGHAMKVWQQKFQVIRSGLASNAEDSGDPVGKEGFKEFLRILLDLKGSTDLMCQGFVALLRSLNFETRLLVSLQPPDNFAVDNSSKSYSAIRESSCPIYWCEVLDEHVQKWVSIDVLTGTVRLPSRNKIKLKIEPPQNDRFNIMRYVMAFSGRGFARDVTRRYAYSWNARTRKRRLEHTEKSSEWILKLFGIFASSEVNDLDCAELKELARYPRLEGIPSRAQDFVGHPEYALVNQLHINEVLNAQAKPCGILSQPKVKSSSSTQNTIYIYRREDVIKVKSSQSWYREGRQIKTGVYPRKHKSTKNKMTGEAESIGLYSIDQTEIYIPPAVGSDGTVPKSEYRTIDVFVKSMIPSGAVHFPVKASVIAAKILKVDYANACVGVEFSKRGAQSKYLGIVVAEKFSKAIYETMDGLSELDQDDMERLQKEETLALWRKFILGIQIWERVEMMNPSNNSSEASASTNEVKNRALVPDVKKAAPSQDKNTTSKCKRNFKKLMRNRVILDQACIPIDANRLEYSIERLTNPTSTTVTEDFSDLTQDSEVKIKKSNVSKAVSKPYIESALNENCNITDTADDLESVDSFNELDMDEISESEL